MHLHLFWVYLCRLKAFSQGDFYAGSARSANKAASDSKSVVQIHRSASQACLERSVPTRSIPACAFRSRFGRSLLLAQFRPIQLAPFGVEVDLPNIPTARSHYGMAIVIFRGKNVTCYDFVKTDGSVQICECKYFATNPDDEPPPSASARMASVIQTDHYQNLRSGMSDAGKNGRLSHFRPEHFKGRLAGNPAIG